MIRWRGTLWMLLAVFPALGGAQTGPYLVRSPGGQRAELQRRTEGRPEPVDLAGLEARTAAYEERVARRGNLAGVSAGRDLGKILAEGHRHLTRPGGADLSSAADRIGAAQELLRDQVASMRGHLAALSRSLDQSPHAAVLRPRLDRQLAELERRQVIVTEHLDSIRDGIQERQDGGLWGRVSSVMRRLVGRDPESRVADVKAVLEQWGASQRPATLSAQVGNEGLTYVTWSSQATAMPQGTVTAAYAGGSAPLTLEDSSAGQETEPSDDLLAKAQELKTAVAIANFVRNELRLEWYRGCLKGAVETIREGGGNDIDLAATTIALMRARQVPARYVQGTIELSVARVAGLMGLLDVSAADKASRDDRWIPEPAVTDAVVRVLTASGIPFEPIMQGGALAAMRMPHTWVEIYLPYGEYRGVGSGRGPAQWIPLEPAITGATKYVAQSPSWDLMGMVPGGASGLIEAFMSRSDQGSPLDAFRSSVAANLSSRGASWESALRSVVLIREDLTVLPGSLPYRVVGVQAEFAVLPAEQKHHARVQVEDEGGVAMEITLPTHGVIGRRATLSYPPATSADEDLVMAAGGLWSAPAALVEVKATIRVDGRTVAQADRPAGLGSMQRWSIEISDTGGKVRRITNPIIAGNLVAIGIGGTRNGYEENDLYEEGDEDGIVSRYGYWQAAAFMNSWSDAEAELARALGVVDVHPTASVTLFESQLQVEETLGIPSVVRFTGFAIDADLRPVIPVELLHDRARDLFLISGFQGSWQEQQTLSDGLGGVRAISTVTLLQAATATGVPLLEISSGNAEAVLPALSLAADMLQEVKDHLARGRIIRIPAHPISLEDWSGTGYIAMNPKTGEAGYYLAGALSGGMTILSTLRWPLGLCQQFGSRGQCLNLGGEFEWWGTQVVDWKGIGQANVSNIVKIEKTDLQSAVVGTQPEKALKVVVYAQWSKLDGSGKLRRYAARIHGAPVTFECFGRAELALGPDSVAAILSGAPEDVAQKVHNGPKKIVKDTESDGSAEIFVAPDPVIGINRSGFLLSGGEPEPALVGWNQVMASIQGARPHDSSTCPPENVQADGKCAYLLRLAEPFTLIAKPGSPARLETTPDRMWGAAGGIEFATPIMARVLDSFGNALANQIVTWSDLGQGGRFVDTGLMPPGASTPKVLSSGDKSLVAQLSKRTAALLPVQASYVPPYAKPEGLLDMVFVSSGALFNQIEVRGWAQENYYLAAKMERESFLPGITGTLFASPITAVVYARTGESWAAVTDRTPGLSLVDVRMETWINGNTDPLDYRSTTMPGSLTFGPDGSVSSRLKYVADGTTQSTYVTAEVRDDQDHRVCCDTEWMVSADAAKVKLQFARVDSALDTLPLPAQGPARVTDRYLSIHVDNPSMADIYLQVRNTASPVLNVSSTAGSALPAGGSGTQIKVPPFKSTISIPLNRAGYDLADNYYYLPKPGSVSVAVLAPWVNEVAGANIALLGDESVTHSMAAAYPGASVAYVEFAGGYECTYYIKEHTLRCDSPGSPADGFAADGYSGFVGTVPSVDRTCVNEPCAYCYRQSFTNAPNVPAKWHGGPIPVGTYDIGQGFLDPARPVMSYRLMKRKVVDCPERDSMMIHFGTADIPEDTDHGAVGVWSDGCIVIPDTSLRDRINRFGGGRLTVVPSRDDPNYLQSCIYSQDASGEAVQLFGAQYFQGSPGARCVGLRQ